MDAVRLTAADALRALRDGADPERARANRWFFRTGPGQYGEGDEFMGLRLPQIRELARQYAALPLAEIGIILDSPLHEARLFALIVLVRQYERAAPDRRDAVFQTWIEHIDRVNNWDLVDLSARILGWHLENADPSFLYDLVESASLWHRRIAIIATFDWIRHGDFDDALRISHRLLDDREDLIHKAVGWMLREIGKVDPDTERAFLRRHAARMPRTMLRYAIEKFPDSERRRFMQMKDTPARPAAPRRTATTRMDRTAERAGRPHP